MARFTDTSGDEWVIDIDAWVWKQFKSRTEANPIEVLVTEAEDPGDFIDLLWVACEDQIKERDLDERGFAKRIGTGEVYDAAYRAFAEAVNDFFPPGRRAKLQTAQTAMREAMERNAAKALQTLQSIGDDSEAASSNRSSESTSVPAFSA